MKYVYPRVSLAIARFEVIDKSSSLMYLSLSFAAN